MSEGNQSGIEISESSASHPPIL